MTNKYTMYEWVLGSDSGHCCFEATVRDLKTQEILCECLENRDAETIAVAMSYHHRLREALGDVVDEWVYGDDIFGSIQKARALLEELDNLETDND